MSPVHHIQFRIPLLRSQELIGQPTIIPRSVRREHLRNRITLPIRLNPQVSRQSIDILSRRISKHTIR
jgi:hypothetical protein